jgi:outer membrane protein TolC
MAKSAKRKTGDAVTTAANRSSKSLPNRSAQATESDIARRAYDLYLTRGCEHGHDVDDWLQAERELRDAVRLAVDFSKDRHEND